MSVYLFPTTTSLMPNLALPPTSQNEQKGFETALRKMPSHTAEEINRFAKSLQFLQGIKKIVPDIELKSLRQFLVQDLSDECLQNAFFKPDGYITRFFSSNENWEEWCESKTALGKVVIYLKDYSTSSTQLNHFINRLDPQTVKKANQEAYEILSHIENPITLSLQELYFPYCTSVIEAYHS